MYTDFYRLQEKPFSLTPSSRFLYLGESHDEAYALLTYGVTERKGFILLTGEVGTGKTTLVRVFLEKLDPTVQYVYLSNPLVSPSDLINYLAFSALNKKEPVKSKIDFLIEFESFLRDSLQHQKNFILIIDEAQKLSFDLLEEVRLLSNMEVGEEKLINIFLVGQPELNDKLNKPECRPLLQRISIRHHIRPLDVQATGEYVATRLKAAGDRNPERVFPRKTLKAIHRYSSGYPRLINILADNSMLYGYTKGRKTITPAIVQRCYEELELAASPLVSKEHSSRIPQTSRSQKLGSLVSHPRLTTAVIVIMFVASILLNLNAQDLFSKFNSSAHVNALDSLPAEPNTELTAQKEPALAAPVVAPPKNTVVPPDPPPREERAGMRSITVKPGDTLKELAATAYGRADDQTISIVLQNNPNIKDGNQIDVGQRILFPFSSDGRRRPVFTVHIASLSPFRAAYKLYQKLVSDGFDVFILPAHNAKKRKTFRITLESFTRLQEAQAYADMLLKRDRLDYAEPIKLESVQALALQLKG